MGIMTANTGPRSCFPRLPPAMLLTLAVAKAMLLAAFPASADWRWTDVERVVAVSDVHGAYSTLTGTLQQAAILDEEARWDGGRAHLVVTGDILDRGAESRKVMDLLMALEEQALAAGGRVHLLLGNHEIMNLVGDLRYVAQGEYAAFASDEDPRERERAFRVFSALQGSAANEAQLEREFAKRAPPGFFGHRRAFAPDGRYGAWLLEKPLLIVIDDTAFVHGGLSPLVAELGLDGVNRELRAEVSEYVAHVDLLVQEGLLDPTESFFRHPEALAALAGQTPQPPQIATAIEGVGRLNAAAVHDTQSPVWYRGNAACGALIENDKLDAALRVLGASRVVVGHTPTPGRLVRERLDGRVIEIDTGMLTASYGGSGHALIIEGQTLSVMSESGTTTAPLPHPIAVPAATERFSATELEDLLTSAEIASAQNQGASMLQIRAGSSNFTGRFIAHPRKRGFVPALAAYRLDRMLGLDMVPVTVDRELRGRAGSLQLIPHNAQTETQRAASGAGASAWCPLPDQWNAMFIFDALLFNASRSPDSIVYDPAGWQLMLLGHEQAFAPRDGRPRWMAKTEIVIGGAWADALAHLTDARLQDELGDLLDERQLRALAKRRDELLDEARKE